MSNSQECVLFKLNDELYGLDIYSVETIEKMLPITRVPYTEDFIKGVINLRGNVVPVMDLRKRFGLLEKEITDETRIIIVKIEDITVGLIVDSSSEVIRFNDDEIEEAPFNKESDINYIKCIGKKNEKLIMIVDIYKILNI